MRLKTIFRAFISMLFCHLLILRGSLTVWLNSCKHWEATQKLAKKNGRICPSNNFGINVIFFFQLISSHYTEHSSATKLHRKHFLYILNLTQFSTHKCLNRRLTSELTGFRGSSLLLLGFCVHLELNAKHIALLSSFYSQISYVPTLSRYEQLRK